MVRHEAAEALGGPDGGMNGECGAGAPGEVGRLVGRDGFVGEGREFDVGRELGLTGGGYGRVGLAAGSTNPPANAYRNEQRKHVLFPRQQPDAHREE